MAIPTPLTGHHSFLRQPASSLGTSDKVLDQINLQPISPWILMIHPHPAPEGPGRVGFSRSPEALLLLGPGPRLSLLSVVSAQPQLGSGEHFPGGADGGGRSPWWPARHPNCWNACSGVVLSHTDARFGQVIDFNQDNLLEMMLC